MALGAAAMLAAVAALAGAQLFDCITETITIAEDETVAYGCAQLTCRRGVIYPEWCPRVPAGCHAIAGNASHPFPDCCPDWHCDCLYGGRQIPRGETVETDECEMVRCDVATGISKVMCGQAPDGCSKTPNDFGKPFPDCCPSWIC